jgi:nicotinate-nucleotide adenylyltransferase
MIGFFGGAFDPVHFGHLKNAQQLKKNLNLSALFLMPCGVSVHKKSLSFSTHQRLKMLDLGLQNFPELDLDKREINQAKPVYSIDSLKAINENYPTQKIALIMGMDSFNQLPHWKNYQDFHHHCHLVVLARPGQKKGQNYCQFKLSSDANDLHNQPAGLIYFADTALLDISSSEIRARLSSAPLSGKIRQKPNLDGLLPDNIINYLSTL